MSNPNIDEEMDGVNIPQTHAAPQQSPSVGDLMSMIIGLQQQLLQQNRQAPATLSLNKPRLPDPVKFSGERSKYLAFEEQLIGKIKVDGSFLGPEDVKVHYAFGLLEQDALEFMRPWMQTNRDKENFTISAFMGHMRDAYQDPELAEYARQKLSTIQQGNRSTIDYIAEFDKTFLEAQSSDLPDWQKISEVRRGLNRKTGRLLVGTAQPREYASWCMHVKSLEREDNAEAMRTNNASRLNYPRPPASQSLLVPPVPSNHQQLPRVETPPAPEVEMTMGAAGQRRRAAWVSQEERERRFKSGLCRRCGASDHILRSCPFLPARRPTPNVSAVYSTPLLEPEKLPAVGEQTETKK